MNLGFKVQPRPLPRVLANGNEPACGEPAGGDVYCERPEGHAGGHLSKSAGRYWQAGAPQAVAS